MVITTIIIIIIIIIIIVIVMIRHPLRRRQAHEAGAPQGQSPTKGISRARVSILFCAALSRICRLRKSPQHFHNNYADKYQNPGL